MKVSAVARKIRITNPTFKGSGFDVCCYHFWQSSAWVVVKENVISELGRVFFHKEMDKIDNT
jgi:hypothetical protein